MPAKPTPSNDDRSPNADASTLRPRFLWESRRRGGDNAAAAEAAGLADLLSPPSPSDVDTALRALADLTGRKPRTIASGKHEEIADDVAALNLTDSEVDVSASDIVRIADALGTPLTLVVDDEAPSGARGGPQGVVWTVPASAGSSYENVWEHPFMAAGLALPVWLEPYADERHPAAPRGSLLSEHAIRAASCRSQLGAMLRKTLLQRTDGTRGLEIAEIERALDTVDATIKRFTREPRVALVAGSVRNWEDPRGWAAEGAAMLRSLIEMVTGDDDAVAAAIRTADNLRVGAVCFAGDPDDLGVSLLDSTVPAHPCSLLLRPRVLSRTLLFTGVPHPLATLPVPQRTLGVYSTVATSSDLADLVRTRLYLGLSPLTAVGIRDAFQGRTGDLEVPQSPENRAFVEMFMSIVTADDSDDQEVFDASMAHAVSRALQVSTTAHPDMDSFGAIVLGAIDFSDVEEMLLPLASDREYAAYQADGTLPTYFHSVREELARHHIDLRPQRPFAGVRS